MNTERFDLESTYALVGRRKVRLPLVDIPTVILMSRRPPPIIPDRMIVANHRRKIHPFVSARQLSSADRGLVMQSRWAQVLVRNIWAFLRPAVRGRKALLIAAGFEAGEGARLVGPRQDVERLKRLLIGEFFCVIFITPADVASHFQARYGYRAEDIVILTDKADVLKESKPTHANIVSKLATGHVKPFHYSL